MPATVKQIIDLISREIPPSAAEDWDNVGLQVGALDAVVERVLVCLEVNEAVIAQAVAENCQLIIAHHPLIFKPLKSLAETTPKGRLVSRLIRARLALYALHTNYDHYAKGLSYLLAQKLALTDIEPLLAVKPQKMYKLIVGVPQDSYQAVAAAAFAAGAGRLGNYAECSFNSDGWGTFKPLVGAQPAIGQVGQCTVVAEVRFETLVLAADLDAVVTALKGAHPYEEVAYDIFELVQPHQPFALGKKGRLKQPLTGSQFANYLKGALTLKSVRLAGDLDKPIRTVAVIAGAGMEFLPDVAQAGVDAFVTGDAKYHEVVETLHYGLLVADVGHFESEVIFGSGFAEQLRQLLAAQKIELTVLAASVERSPFHYF